MAPEVLLGSQYNEKVDVFRCRGRWGAGRQAAAAGRRQRRRRAARPLPPISSHPRAASLPCSFGVVLYELVHRKMIVAELMYLGSAEDAEAFAYRVAAGYRMPIAPEVPPALAKLILDCMAGTPELRPR